MANLLVLKVIGVVFFFVLKEKFEFFFIILVDPILDDLVLVFWRLAVVLWNLGAACFFIESIEFFVDINARFPLFGLFFFRIFFFF
jgi:hypothetical protein